MTSKTAVADIHSRDSDYVKSLSQYERDCLHRFMLVATVITRHTHQQQPITQHLQQLHASYTCISSGQAAQDFCRHAICTFRLLRLRSLAAVSALLVDLQQSGCSLSLQQLTIGHVLSHSLQHSNPGVLCNMQYSAITAPLAKLESFLPKVEARQPQLQHLQQQEQQQPLQVQQQQQQLQILQEQLLVYISSLRYEPATADVCHLASKFLMLLADLMLHLDDSRYTECDQLIQTAATQSTRDIASTLVHQQLRMLLFTLNHVFIPNVWLSGAQDYIASVIMSYNSSISQEAAITQALMLIDNFSTSELLLLSQSTPSDFTASLLNAFDNIRHGEATRTAAAQQIVASAMSVVSPITATTAPATSPSCAVCGTKDRGNRSINTAHAQPLMRCGKCNRVHYCCREHQLEDWKKGHKYTCSAFVAVAAAEQRHAVFYATLTFGDRQWLRNTCTLLCCLCAHVSDSERISVLLALSFLNGCSNQPMINSFNSTAVQYSLADSSLTAAACFFRHADYYAVPDSLLYEMVFLEMLPSLLPLYSHYPDTRGRWQNLPLQLDIVARCCSYTAIKRVLLSADAGKQLQQLLQQLQKMDFMYVIRDSVADCADRLRRVSQRSSNRNFESAQQLLCASYSVIDVSQRQSLRNDMLKACQLLEKRLLCESISTSNMTSSQRDLSLHAYLTAELTEGSLKQQQQSAEQIQRSARTLMSHKVRVLEMMREECAVEVAMLLRQANAPGDAATQSAEAKAAEQAAAHCAAAAAATVAAVAANAVATAAYAAAAAAADAAADDAAAAAVAAAAADADVAAAKAAVAAAVAAAEAVAAADAAADDLFASEAAADVKKAKAARKKANKKQQKHKQQQQKQPQQLQQPPQQQQQQQPPQQQSQQQPQQPISYLTECVAELISPLLLSSAAATVTAPAHPSSVIAAPVKATTLKQQASGSTTAITKATAEQAASSQQQKQASISVAVRDAATVLTVHTTSHVNLQQSSSSSSAGVGSNPISHAASDKHATQQQLQQLQQPQQQQQQHSPQIQQQQHHKQQHVLSFDTNEKQPAAMDSSDHSESSTANANANGNSSVDHIYSSSIHSSTIDSSNKSSADSMSMQQMQQQLEQMKQQMAADADKHRRTVAAATETAAAAERHKSASTLEIERLRLDGYSHQRKAAMELEQHKQAAVAATAAATIAATAAASATTAENDRLRSQLEDRVCVICLDEPRVFVLHPCRHCCLCVTCAAADTSLLCPMCRTPYTSMERIF